MEIEELTIEQAKEIFYSEKAQQSWEVVSRMIGPPIEYAFKDDIFAKMYLSSAFGAMLVRRDANIATKALEKVKKACATNFDWAVWALAMGTYIEAFGERSKAIDSYEQAIEKYAGTYVAYFRMAKIAYDGDSFCTAKKRCQQGLSYLRTDELYEQDRLKVIEEQYMSFLGEILQKMKAKASAAEKVVEPYNPPKRTMAEIWEIKDPTDFIIALIQHIVDKCEVGDDIDKLSAPERVFYVTHLLEMEVNNGGFSQFFFNSSGDYANEVVDAFVEMGAIKTAEICKKAFSIYGDSVPADREEREGFLVDNDEIEDILDECDNAFYEYEDDLSTLVCQYVLKNKEFFT